MTLNGYISSVREESKKHLEASASNRPPDGRKTPPEIKSKLRITNQWPSQTVSSAAPWAAASPSDDIRQQQAIKYLLGWWRGIDVTWHEKQYAVCSGNDVNRKWKVNSQMPTQFIQQHGNSVQNEELHNKDPYPFLLYFFYSSRPINCQEPMFS